MTNTRTALAALAIASLAACTGPVPAIWNNSRDRVAVAAPADSVPGTPASPAATADKPDTKPAAASSGIPSSKPPSPAPQRPMPTQKPRTPAPSRPIR